ncbi:MAG: hypothetical protein A2W26_05565 [Acidobacteria bacterium RBG_16_64_8]|nr:MAG: hypothetical protein A2W26_05565 [Acidobacteria bacterium RBG_16_64_8]
MRGHVKKRSTWQFVIDLGLHPLQGCPACRKRYWMEGEPLRRCPKCHGPLEDRLARRQEFHTGYASKREAEEELAKALASITYGTYTQPSKMLLGEFLKDEWLPAIESTIRPTTFLSYQSHVECHLVPALGRIPLQQVTGAQINAFYARLMGQGGDGGKRKVSPSTVRRIHATLHRAMKDALRWNRITRNPADAADPPRTGGEREMKVWSLKELKAFLAQERENRLYPLWLTLATTGMRRGEILGLRWTDVDLEARSISICQTRVLTGYQPLLSTPKTRRGKRLVALDPATMAALREHRRRQKEECLAAGSSWKDSGFVFTKEEGEPYHPERVSKLFIQASKKAGLPGIRLHDLRHYADCRIMPTVPRSAWLFPSVCRS